MHIMPVGKRVLITPKEEEQKGTIIVTNMKPKRFRVLAIGDEVTKVSPQDTIYLEKHYGIEIDHEGEKYLVIDESSILAKIF